MSKSVEFDELLDVVFPEVYRIACEMEHSGRIDPMGNSMDEFCKDCKQIAADYIEWYKNKDEYFSDDLPKYAEKRLIEIYPPTHPYDVITYVTVQRSYHVYAANKDEACKSVRETLNDLFKKGEIINGCVVRVAEKEGLENESNHE